MILKAYLIYKNDKKKINIKSQKENAFIFENLELNEELKLKIYFKEPIAFIKTYKYNWERLSKTHITSSFSPLILQLSNGTYVQSNKLVGYWKFEPKTPNILIWEINPNFSTPISKFEPPFNFKNITSAVDSSCLIDLQLLCSEYGGVEISRSKLSFSGIICFTDHCDFDNETNLKTQRQFFKKYGIITTKGFFLNDYSSRDNASWEKNSEELKKWIEDGHELAYHSLSQSIKPLEQSISDFTTFLDPFLNIKVWMDHGFQPYNYSLYQANGISHKDYDGILKKHDIITFWNYMDCGITTKNVINQLNSGSFTLNNYWRGIKTDGTITALIKVYKVYLFYYLKDESVIYKYKKVSKLIKSFIKLKSLNTFLKLSVSILQLFYLFIKLIFTWQLIKNRIFSSSFYTPIYFKNKVNESKYNFFQTIELLDFRTSFSKSNLDLLVNESGVCIGHTYFAVQHSYHKGRLLQNDLKVDNIVESNFNYLSELIRNNKIWNPTLSELLSHLENVKDAEFDLDSQGHIYIKNPNGLIYRSTQV